MKHILPEDIEQTSMSIIAQELGERGIVLPKEHDAVVKRVIHTTADFDFARNLSFTPNAVDLAKAALLRGAAIVTDTNMARAGISKPALTKLDRSEQRDLELWRREHADSRKVHSSSGKDAALYPGADERSP